MDDDWDLHAVLRGFSTTGTTNTNASTATDSPFPSSSSLPLHNNENSYGFSDRVDERDDPFQGLHEIYRKFCVDEQISPSSAVASSLVPTSAAYNNQEILQMPPPQMNMQTQENSQFKINPVCASSSNSLNIPASNSPPTRNRRKYDPFLISEILHAKKTNKLFQNLIMLMEQEKSAGENGS